MKQKPIFLKYLTIAVSIVTMLIPAARLLHLNTNPSNQEGYHPKAVNLAGPDAIIGVDNKTYYVNGSCDSVNVYTKTLTSTCGSPSLDSLSYTLDGGPDVILISGPANPPDSVFIGRFPVDTIQLNWYVRENCSGNNGSQTQRIFIRDTIKPTAICKNITVDLNSTGDTVLTASLFDNNSIDNCGGPLTFSTNPSNLYFSCNDVATSPVPVTLIVTDKSGNSATCTASVTVRDLILPSIICPANVTLNANTNQCYATNVIASLGQPITNDNCLPVKDTLRRFNGDTLKTTTQLPVGTNTIVWIVTDKHNNTSSCSQQVVVRDVQAPSINCPANITVNAPANTCAANATFVIPAGTDNCPGVTTTQTMGLTSGASYPVGVTTNRFRATDAAGNSAECSFTVTVRDTDAPTISCPTNITANAANGICAVNVNYTAPVGTDLCSGANTTQIAGMASGASFPVGVTTNTFRVTDASGNSTTCSFTVTVVDNQIPAISCPADMTIFAPMGQCSATINYTAPTGTDNCSNAVTTLTGGLASGAVFPVGTTAITYRVTAANGATATCSFNITLKDIDLPSISCPANITMNATPGTCASVVTYTSPIGTDLCPGASTIQTSGLASGASFPVGITTNTFRVTDASGNTATCSFTVTIRDAQIPSITCPANITINAVNGTCAANVNYTAPVGTDLCSGVSTMQTTGMASGASFPVGVTINTFTVTDASLNTATCSFTVTVLDIQLPTISCPANITMNAEPGICTANVTYTAPVGTDICPGANTTQTSGFASGAPFPVGVTTNTFRVADGAGNTATCSFTVTVIDNQLPVINCPADMTVNAQNGACSASVNYTAPVGTDNCPGATTSRIGGLASGAVFPVGMTTITYRVTAANGASATCSFKVTVQDLQPPMISCPAVDSVILNNQCSLLVPDLRSKITRSDNCGIDTLLQSPSPGTILPSSHNQQHIFTFTVTDLGGMTASCTTTVTSKDKLGPDIICRQTRIISISGEPKVSAQSFVTSASDGCGGLLSYKIRRMASNTLQDSVTFTCDDVNDTILVVVRVSDLRGNFTECMDTAIVKDLISPAIAAILPDITVSCAYPLNINNLSAFGTYKHQDSVRLTNVINDAGNTTSPSTTFQNGVFNENCPGSIVSSTLVNLLNTCNTGELKRAFLITDAAGNSIRDTQSIFVFDFNKFNLSDITWPPAQVDYYNCTDVVPDTTITKSPGLINDKCSQAMATFADQPFNNPAFCKSILRTWTVIDWCQYKTNTPNSPGKWTFDQLIVIKDTIAPVINAGTCRDTVFCAPLANCNASVTLSASGRDNCTALNVIVWTYKIDLNNNGGNPDITGIGRTFTRTFDLGTHKLTWEAKDECGNTSTCSFLFTIKDCKAPNAIAMQGLATNIMPGMGMAIMKASDFNNFSNDNCTAGNMLRYSFSADVNDVTRTYTCDSIGKRTVNMWVTDLANNQSKAITFVTVQDNQNACGNAGKINISGTVYTENRVFVPDTKVTIDGGETEGETITDKTGKYSFKDLAKYNNYQLLPQKNTGHLDGITTLDLVIIQRHILGVKTLESPYKLIAADVNNSKSITASDLVEMRKMVLGLQNEFTNNTSWRFVDAAYSFSDINQPWPFAENLQYEGLETNMTKSDFIAIKTGDVNGSVSVNFTDKTYTRNNKTVQVYTDEINVNAGDIIAVPVYAENLYEISGFQWTMELLPGLTFSGYEAASFDLKDDNIAQIERNGKKYLTLSIDHQKVVDKKDASVLFYLIFNAAKSGSIQQLLKFSGEITPALAVMNGEEERNISFTFRTKENSETEYIYQNQPNPFKNETLVHLSLKKATAVNISIFDAKGSSIYNGVENLAAGTQVIPLNEKHLGNHVGVFYCRIKANEINKVIKMLRIE